MKKFLTNYVIFILLVSCGHNPHWREISPKGLEGQFNDILFIDDSIGWIVGNKIAMSLKNQDAVIYKTTDGGYSWTINYVGKGSFEIITGINDTMFGVKHVFKEDSYEGVNSVFIISFDKGQNWKEVIEIPGVTKQLSFSNTQTGYLITKNKESNINDWKLLKTMDGGLTWKLIGFFNNVQSGLIVNNSFFMNQYNGNSLLVFDSEQDTIFAETFPKGFKSELIIKDNNDNIWVIGSDNHDFVLLKREEANRFVRIEFDMIKDAKPYDFYTHINIRDNTISIITGDGGTIMGVAKRFFISYDLGRSWTEEEIPFSMIVKPICFDRDRIWSYNGIGLQIRK